ncbi:kynureninase [Halovivax limisalsi]|uniref:kynureninase n=1 Tax=Halovivax limisalsi TaxID=1453760 RepID=UPI001FFD0A62|nr:kynureninase [Halovivax limisalsi]
MPRRDEDGAVDSDRTRHDLHADRESARERDRADPLSEFRQRFEIPDAHYAAGNSLGPISDAAEASLQRAIDQWRDLAVRGWTEAEPPWFWYGERLGEQLAPVVGAEPAEVVVANSTTVNIHTLIGTFLDGCGRDDPTGVLVNELDFPTDHYAIRAQLRQRELDPDAHLHVVESRDGRTIRTDDVVAAMDAHDVGIVFMPSVLYRSGQLLDVEAITAAAHERGILAGFDLAHSIGVVPHQLSEIGVDFAVWCSYKYLNAGPGAVAGLYVNERHFDETPALAGWWGHEKGTQFEMNLEYTPAAGAGAWQSGTIPVFSAAPLFGALELVNEAGIEAIRQKSIALTSYLIALADDRLADRGVAVGTPREPARRGGHVALEHPEAGRLSEALRDHGVIVDYRPPNVIRVAPSPLYTSFEAVFDVVDLLAELLADRRYEAYDAESEVT